MKIVFAADHAGYALKEVLKAFVIEEGHEAVDVGAHAYDENDDYPDFCIPAAEMLRDDPSCTRAIVLGGSGQGEAMVVNRFAHVRAVAWYGERDGAQTKGLEVARLAREHGNSNVLSIGARFVSDEEAKEAVRMWLRVPFPEDERHVRRLEKVARIGGA